MSDVAIRCEGLGKRYRIGRRESYRALRDVLADAASAPFRRLRKYGGPRPEASASEFWALDDVSFEVKHGEVVGVIGRNGAGKSTLLKILSRITKPTRGEVKINGRVGSLLEVGTGFHPELSGRENIFLNGAILGLKRIEIKRKFDEIVAFAEVEKFIDTPVKRYSSGMYVRLAFAVAAHLEPEILLVDEVLAVGDASFQKKCLGKMGKVAQDGRTVFFVSHNMGAISQLCSRGILLDRGVCSLDTNTSAAISAYLKASGDTNSAASFNINADSEAQITSMAVTSLEGHAIGEHPHTQPFCITIDYRVSKWRQGSYLCLDVFNETDTRLLWSSDVQTVDEMLLDRREGKYKARVTIPGMILTPGRYYFTAAIYTPGIGPSDVKDKVISVDILDAGSLLSNFGIKPHAATMIPLAWDTKCPQEV